MAKNIKIQKKAATPASAKNAAKKAADTSDAKQNLSEVKLNLLAAVKTLAKAGDPASAGAYVVVLPDVQLDCKDPDSNITLSVTFGGANQIGAATYIILGQPPSSAKSIGGSTDKPLIIDKCKNLTGQTLDIEADITDANKDPKNNDAVITIELKCNDVQIYYDTHTLSVANDGDTARFTYQITFYV